MSSDPQIIKALAYINIEPGLLHAAKVECDGLSFENLNDPDPLKTCAPGQKGAEVIRFVQQKCARPLKEGSVISFHPGAPVKYLPAPSIVIPIEKDGLPITMKTEGGKDVTVNWDMGKAWEVCKPVRLGTTDKKGGTLIVWWS